MAKHRCDMCRPHQREYNRLRLAGRFRSDGKGAVEVARYKLDTVRRLVCSDSPPELDEAYLPGGKYRKWFLDRRITAKCPPCQRLADELVIVRETARSFRDAHRERVQSPHEPGPPADSPGQHAALQTHFARALEEMLRDCERIKCPPEGAS